METKCDNPVGLTEVSIPPNKAKAASSGHKHRPGKIYRVIMNSPVVEPFRHVLRPLLRWAWRPHFSLFGGLDRVDFKPPGTLAIVMTILLGPLVFIMLLPLILVLFPVALVAGMMAVVASSAQCTS